MRKPFNFNNASLAFQFLTASSILCFSVSPSAYAQNYNAQNLNSRIQQSDGISIAPGVTRIMPSNADNHYGNPYQRNVMAGGQPPGGIRNNEPVSTVDANSSNMANSASNPGGEIPYMEPHNGPVTISAPQGPNGPAASSPPSQSPNSAPGSTLSVPGFNPNTGSRALAGPGSTGAVKKAPVVVQDISQWNKTTQQQIEVLADKKIQQQYTEFLSK